MARPNSRTLAMRDPALASALGLVGKKGTHFGADATFGNDFGGEFVGSDFGGLDYWGADPAAGVAQALVAAPANGKAKMNLANPMHLAKLSALWDAHAAGQSKTSQRESILNPNAGSATKVEGYEFPLGTQVLTIGIVNAVQITRNPSVKIRPKRFFTSTPCPAFLFLQTIQVSNINAVVGGNVDSYNYSPLAVNSMLNLPTIEPSLSASVSGRTTTIVPPGVVGGSLFEWGCSFQGPATVVGQ